MVRRREGPGNVTDKVQGLVEKGLEVGVRREGG